MKREIVLSKTPEGILFGCPSWERTIDSWLHSISKGTYVIKLEKMQKQRTISQNALMWTWFEAIAQEWSEATDECYTKEQVKEMFTRKFLPVDSPLGVVGRSTSSLNTEQMTEFLNRVQAYMAQEWGITLPSTEDREFEEWKKQYA